MKDQLAMTAANVIREKISFSLDIGLILGSGLGSLADEMEQAQRISYSDLPGFPISTVEGHAGRFVFGSLSGKKVVAMQGRFHYYEGYSLEEVTFPIQVLHLLGVKKLIITNAAGGINPAFHPGDLMIITDHINNMGNRPVFGLNRDLFDISKPYSENFIHKAEKVAANLKLTIQKGVYVANSGPAYETPAEIRMLRKFGGDAVGMSTVPEVIVARNNGIEVLGISCISNMAAGICDQPLSHEEVIGTTEIVKKHFSSFLKSLIHDI